MSVRELPAADAGGAFIVDHFGAFVDGAREFLTKLTRRSGTASFEMMRQNLKQQLNFDPFDVKSYEAWGIDTQAGVVIFTEAPSPLPILAISVKDQKKFDVAFEALLTTSDGASKFSTETVGPFTMQLAGRPFGTEIAPAMAWAHVNNFVLIARADATASLRTALTRLTQTMGKKDAPNLASDATFRDTVAKLPPGDALLYARGDAASFAGSAAGTMGRALATSLKINAQGLSADIYAGLPVAGFDKALAGPAPLELLARIADDAVLVGISRAARPEALTVLRSQPALSTALNKVLAQAQSQIGLDPEKDILPLLAGPVTVSVHIQKLDGVAGQLQRHLSLDSLLDFVHVIATADLKDAKAMAAVLERSREALQKRGVLINKHNEKIGGHDIAVYSSGVPKGAPAGTVSKLGWAIAGNVYVYAAGAGRLTRELELLSGTGTALTGKLAESSSKLASEAGTSVLVLRAGSLAERAQSLGVGVDASKGIDAIIAPAIGLLQSLGDIAIGVSGEPDGLRLKLREQLQ